MQNLNYQEGLFSTTDTKFAAVLLLFGFRLSHPFQPLEWSIEYDSKDLYLRGAKELDLYLHGKKKYEDLSVKPSRSKLAWNFSHIPFAPGQLFESFSGEGAEEKFDALTDNRGRVEDDPDLSDHAFGEWWLQVRDGSGFPEEESMEDYTAPVFTGDESTEYRIKVAEVAQRAWREARARSASREASLIDKIKVAQSAVIAQSARNVLENREYLITVLKARPPSAKWITVFRKDGKFPFRKFGVDASLETRMALLNTL